MIKIILLIIITCILLFINIKEPFNNNSKAAQYYKFTHNYAHQHGLPLDVVHNMIRKMMDSLKYNYVKNKNYM